MTLLLSLCCFLVLLFCLFCSACCVTCCGTCCFCRCSVHRYRHATNQAKAQQFIQASHALFHSWEDEEDKEAAAAREPHYIPQFSSSSSSSSSSASFASMTKRREERLTATHHATPRTFLRVLNTARLAGALLPDKHDLQAMAQRMVGTSGGGTLVVHC